MNSVCQQWNLQQYVNFRQSSRVSPRGGHPNFYFTQSNFQLSRFLEIWLQQNFAHVMTALLSWHVQNFDVIQSFKFELLPIPKYEVGEVFPWGGISVIFPVCVSISSFCDHLHEINLWLDFRHNNKFYGAWISPKITNHGDVAMHTIKIFETTVISC